MLTVWPPYADLLCLYADCMATVCWPILSVWSPYADCMAIAIKWSLTSDLTLRHFWTSVWHLVGTRLPFVSAQSLNQLQIRLATLEPRVRVYADRMATVCWLYGHRMLTYSVRMVIVCCHTPATLVYQPALIKNCLSFVLVYSSLGDDTCNASPHNRHCVQIWVTLFAHQGHILLKKAIAETLALCLVPRPPYLFG